MIARILSSPLTWIAFSYLAADICLWAQTAPVPVSPFWGWLLIPMTFIGAVTGVILSIRNFLNKTRYTESVLAVLAALPMLLIWAAVFSRLFVRY